MKLKESFDFTSPEQVANLLSGWKQPSYAMAILEDSSYSCVYSLEGKSSSYNWDVWEIGEVFIVISSIEDRGEYIERFLSIAEIAENESNWLSYDEEADAFTDISKQHIFDSIDPRTQLSLDRWLDGEEAQNDMDYIGDLCLKENLTQSEVWDLFTHYRKIA